MEIGEALFVEEGLYTQLKVSLEEGRIDNARDILVGEAMKINDLEKRDAIISELYDDDGAKALLECWAFLSGYMKQSVLKILVRRYSNDNPNFSY